ncbi:MAG: transketolase [Alphaproteobacteria bacterium]|nr:transketolase [Alphaproteobacteria bacterium]
MPVSLRELEILQALERKVLWLSSWTIHNANHLRPSRDGLKVGGHQASSASLASVMTALYFNVLRPEDRVAVKPHASPVFHAIQYLFGRESRERLEQFRAFGGAQSYPSRTKDDDDVDFSTGSVGMGGALTLFASLVQDYLHLQGLAPAGRRKGRMVALLGDAELDEGNIFEALLEGWKHEVRDLWWVIDYNRQSLDSVISDRLYTRFDEMFESMGWKVVILKYGKRLEAVFRRPGGEALREWIDACPNSLYSALVFKGGAAWRDHLTRDIGRINGIPALLDTLDDDGLHRLMTNLAGHDMASLLEAFHAVDSNLPHCFIAYTIKGHGLPFAGHKDNHSGLMTPGQMVTFKAANGIADGAEWERYSGLDVPAPELERFVSRVPFAARATNGSAAPLIDVPVRLPLTVQPRMSTQEAFGRIMNDLARSEAPIARHVVTASPDVTVSTNLGGWVNRRGVFGRTPREDTFAHEKVVSPLRWATSPKGQHVELGIAENNLFLLLAALGLAGPIFGTRLLPVGTLYDPFIRRGLDALDYACYQGARFMLVATPSGIALGPEGGAHQSISTPLIGLGQDGIVCFEPAYVDELAEIMRWSFAYMQAEDGGAVYLRLSTRSVAQPDRQLSPGMVDDIIAGAYWHAAPAPGATLAVVCSGAVAPEAIVAHGEILEDVPGAGLLMVPSADRLFADWRRAQESRSGGAATGPAQIERLLAPLAPAARLITVLDGHPATLSWLGSVAGHGVHPLGVDHFGQSGDLTDLFRAYRIDSDAILEAAASACLQQAGLRT